MRKLNDVFALLLVYGIFVVLMLFTGSSEIAAFVLLLPYGVVVVSMTAGLTLVGVGAANHFGPNIGMFAGCVLVLSAALLGLPSVTNTSNEIFPGMGGLVIALAVSIGFSFAAKLTFEGGLLKVSRQTRVANQS